MQISINTMVKVALLVLGGIVVNKLSDFFDTSAPVIILVSFVTLIAMLVYESQMEGHDEPSSAPAKFFAKILNESDHIKFALASLILGAIIATISILPLIDSRIFWVTFPGRGRASFTNYEAGAAITITLLACLAALRRRSLLRLSLFLVSTIYGMTITIAYFKSSPDYEFTLTFLSWLGGATTVTTVIYWMPDIYRLFSEFWGRGSTLEPNSREHLPVEDFHDQEVNPS